jgi:hypothetical protein
MIPEYAAHILAIPLTGSSLSGIQVPQMISKFLQRKCTIRLLEVISEKKSIRREGVCLSM